jgi:hypothetical protein
MRNILLVGWLLLPVGAWAFHEGPGQTLTELEQTDGIVRKAHTAANDGRWREAVAGYEEALKTLPKETQDVMPRLAQRLHLELNKARMQASGLPVARQELETLVEQLTEEKDGDAQLLDEARHALAHAQFYTTWLMRLEGLDRTEWEPEIEASRQNFRLLAEKATDAKQAAARQGDVEAAIHLARLELEDLQGLPLPGE